jgi:hypothetical protein
MKSALFVLLVLFTLLTSSTVTAHSPIGGSNNESLQTAMRIHDPAKSWAIYSELHNSTDVGYYKFDIKAGQRIYISLFVPGDSGFKPAFALMGPSLSNDGVLPSFVEVPATAGVVVELPKDVGPSFEPFTPSAQKMLAQFDVEAKADGTYFIAVFPQEGTGSYGLAIGYNEQFTAQEWLLIPYNLIEIYIWEGQSPAAIATLPIVVAIMAFIAGLLFIRKRGIQPGPRRLLSITVGAVFFATCMLNLDQIVRALAMGPTDSGAAAISLVFVVSAFGLGLWVMFLALGKKPFGGKGDLFSWRVRFLVIGLLGLLVWAGLFIGPALAFVSACIPADKNTKEGKSHEALASRQNPSEE